MQKRSGITMLSMVIYVTLFFAFTALAISMGSNMNYSSLVQKGKLYINEEASKIQYNLVNSAKSSDDINNIYGKLVFSNNDEYTYDNATKKLLKNGGVLATDVEEFKIIDVYNMNFVNDEVYKKIDTSIPSTCIEIKLKKYGQEKKVQIFVSAGDEVNE